MQFLILALLGSGFQAANATDTTIKAGFLRFHIPVAIIVLRPAERSLIAQ